MSSKIGTVVIGGGSGFIGRALIAQLKMKGYNTIIISRKPGESCMTWNDLQTSGLPNETVAVVNLAGQNVLDPTRRWSIGFKQNVWASRVNTTRYLAEAIQQAQTKPRVFITTSGVGFYPPDDSKTFDENGEGGDFDFLSKLCTDWEAASQLPSELNVRRVIMRVGVVLGRDGGMIQQLIFPFYFGVGGPIGSGKQFMPWIHIQDVASIYLYAIEQDSLNGVVNAVAPDIITNEKFSKAFAAALWRPALLPLPVFVLNMIFSSERAKIMTEGPKVIPSKAVSSGFNFQYPTIESAAKEFATLFPRNSTAS